MVPSVRLQVYLHGRVQGVGMRYFVFLQAKQLHLEGFVRNLPDGTVEVVAEGPKRQLEKLALALQACTVGKITKLDTNWENATGEFNDFSIKR